MIALPWPFILLAMAASLWLSLRQQWHLFAIPADELFGSFFDAMNAFECPLGHSGLPRHMMHDTDK
ncbi:hypothetical protein [Klebsiella oxytoca]|uniref:hypothetical protein n=1 Tax=Klebsiella oxytoca TaxID=571 RepID=UPI00259A2679|nr:hypothetical protein [Klebsiella oxytoca]MDM4095924.1 hypothetical protein [Klebsiella oxytoca]